MSAPVVGSCRPPIAGVAALTTARSGIRACQLGHHPVVPAVYVLGWPLQPARHPRALAVGHKLSD